MITQPSPLVFIELHVALTWLFFFIVSAGALAGALTAIYKVLKPIVEKCDAKWFKPIRDSVGKQTEINEKLARIEEQQVKNQEVVESIRSEVKPNGGGSLNDKVTRIEASVEHQACELNFRKQTSPQAVFEMDPNLNWVSANRALCDLLNVESTALLQRGWINSLEHSNRERILLECKQAVENKIPINSRWKVLDGENEEMFEIRIHAEPYMRNRSGELMCFFGYVQIAR